jgi:serine/threonine protein phosphatase PrpC
MGSGFRDKPLTFINVRCDRTVTSAVMQGWPKEQCAYVAHSYSGAMGMTLLAVFDGLGGSALAEYLSYSIESKLTAEFKAVGDPAKALRNCLVKIDEYCCSTVGARSILLSSRSGDSACDVDAFGSTATVVLVDKEVAYCGALGNSRCVMATREGLVNLSYDHSPVSEEERARLRRMKVSVVNGLIEGRLDVTRTLGHRLLKSKKILLREPEIIVESTSEARLIMLASRGVWECRPQAEVLDFLLDEGQEADNKRLEKVFFGGLAQSPYKADTGCGNMAAVVYRFK